MDFSQWEIVYIKFPFTDLTNYKLRPALIVSNKTYNKKDNLIFLWIFSNEWIKEFSYIVNQEDLLEWKILKQSFFRFQNIFSLDKSLIERKIWKIKKDKLENIISKLQNYTNLDK